jgi:hypothetical protein
VFTDRSHQQIGVDTIEEALDVQIQNPRVTPASLPRHADRIERRFAGPVAIRVRVETRLHQWLKVPFDNCLGDAVGNRGHTHVELHFYPTNPWNRLKLFTRFIPCADSDSSS